MCPLVFGKPFSFFPAAEMWQKENELWAILSPLDTMMIVDTDWAASHSHPGISVWTVMSKTYACQSLSVSSFCVFFNNVK